MIIIIRATSHELEQDELEGEIMAWLEAASVENDPIQLDISIADEKIWLGELVQD